MEQATSSLGNAIHEWREILGEQRVLMAEEVRRRYGPGTGSAGRHIPVILLPVTREEVAALVRIAARHGVPLYPVSTGRNWGYGDATPVRDECVVVDLSGMARVVAIDADLGLATVEPGVTQGLLHGYLDAHHLPFMVPTTGAGPECSLVGNALERGYGITPYTDHFGAVTALEVVLPSGEIYRTPLSNMGATEADRAYKWGIGPYVDGLFAQGCFGIVTQMTIALVRVPERIEAFSFQVAREQDLEAVVEAVREILRVAGGMIGGINLMSALRWAAMATPFPSAAAGPDGSLSAAALESLLAGLPIGSWVGLGCLYGDSRIVAAGNAVVRRILGPRVRDLRFARSTAHSSRRGSRRRLPLATSPAASAHAAKLASALDLLSGVPNHTASPLAYWRATAPRPQQRRDPGRDGCGLLWYSPLVPMKPERVREYVALVRRVCARHGMPPLITMTSLSERLLDGTVPLLFDRENEAATARAEACYRALFDEGRREGFVPYRVSSQNMHLIVDPEQPFWHLVRQLKRAVDPAGILAPGRYCPLDDPPCDAEAAIPARDALPLVYG